MKLPTFLLAVALVLYDLAYSESSEHHHHDHRSSGAGTCSLNSTGPYHSITLQTQFDCLTVTGEGFSGPSGTELSLTIRAGGDLIIEHSQSSSDGGYNTSWDYREIFSGIHHLSLLTHADNTTVRVVDGGQPNSTFTNRALVPRGQPNSTFTNGTSVPRLIGTQEITSALNGLSDHIQDVLRTCQPSQAKRWTKDAPSVILKRQNQFGVAPKFDDPGSEGPCKYCIVEAYAASAACGVACGLTFGFGCGCIAGIPFIFAQCHNPGTGLGQGCCPVSCGSASRVLGIDVVYSCCSSGDSCVNPSTGACCTSGFEACGGDVCCPSDAPCRDVGICCPTNRNTCITSNGPICCNEGEDCVGGTCCPHDSVANGQCCPPDSQTCCTGRLPSRCPSAFSSSIQNCINNQWVSSPCPHDGFCLQSKTEGAGSYCVWFCGRRFCSLGLLIAGTHYPYPYGIAGGH